MGEQGCQTTVHGATCEALPATALYLTPYSQWSFCKKRSDFLNFYNGPTVGDMDPRAYSESHWDRLWEWSEKKVEGFLK